MKIRDERSDPPSVYLEQIKQGEGFLSEGEIYFCGPPWGSDPAMASCWHAASGRTTTFSRSKYVTPLSVELVIYNRSKK